MSNTIARYGVAAAIVAFLIWGAVTMNLSQPSSETVLREAEAAVFAALDAAPAPEEAAAPVLLAEAKSGDEVRGAPLGGAPAESEEEVRGEPLGAGAEKKGESKSGAEDLSVFGDVNSLTTPHGGTAIRQIPDSSFEMLDQIGGEMGMNSDELIFEKTKDGKYTKVSFGQLGSYVYEWTDPDLIRESADPTKPIKDQIPEEIKALDGKEVIIVGFMVPIEFKRDQLVGFALTMNQAFCCFGIPPEMNEWIMVEMEEGKHTYFEPRLPVAVYGKMEVGEVIYDGYVESIYRMTGTEVIDTRELLKRAGQGS